MKPDKHTYDTYVSHAPPFRCFQDRTRCKQRRTVRVMILILLWTAVLIKTADYFLLQNFFFLYGFNLPPNCCIKHTAALPPVEQQKSNPTAISRSGCGKYWTTIAFRIVRISRRRRSVIFSARYEWRWKWSANEANNDPIHYWRRTENEMKEEKTAWKTKTRNHCFIISNPILGVF